MNSIFHELCDILGCAFQGAPFKKGSTSRNTALLAVALLCVVLPFEIHNLAGMLVGAAAYLLHCVLRDHAPPHASKREGALHRATVGVVKVSRHFRGRDWKATRAPCVVVAHPRLPEIGTETGLWTPSAKPVAAPTFQAAGWEAEVDEFVGQIMPTPECEQVVAHIARIVKRAIGPVFPDADVVTFTNSNLRAGRAFGVAVPDVDIVANVSASSLAKCLQNRSARSRSMSRLSSEHFDVRQQQKYAIRICTDELFASTGLKFRRSAFRLPEPKVTFVAPTSLGFGEVTVPVDFSVNSLAPLHNAALLTECEQLEPRAKAIALLARRWAKDRGVCHAAKGHLPPYVWTLLVIYFLQVRGSGEGPLLPPFEGLELSSGFVVKRGEPKVGKTRSLEERARSGMSLAELFKDFFRFYASFDWRGEAVTVRSGERAAPGSSLPPHTIVSDDGVAEEVGPSIEDPFSASQNLGSCLTAWSFARLKEEFSRAHGLCASGASLTKLLEPWAPPEPGEAKEEGALHHASVECHER